MAREVAARMQKGIVDEIDLVEPAPTTDASLTSDAAYEEFESSARLITPLAPALPRRMVHAAASSTAATPVPFRPSAELVAVPANLRLEAPLARPEEASVFRSRKWRAEAWDRERERELRAVEQRPDIAARRTRA